MDVKNLPGGGVEVAADLRDPSPYVDRVRLDLTLKHMSFGVSQYLGKYAGELTESVERVLAGVTAEVYSAAVCAAVHERVASLAAARAREIVAEKFSAGALDAAVKAAIDRVVADLERATTWQLEDAIREAVYRETGVREAIAARSKNAAAVLARDVAEKIRGKAKR